MKAPQSLTKSAGVSMNFVCSPTKRCITRPNEKRLDRAMTCAVESSIMPSRYIVRHLEKGTFQTMQPLNRAFLLISRAYLSFKLRALLPTTGSSVRSLPGACDALVMMLLGLVRGAGRCAASAVVAAGAAGATSRCRSLCKHSSGEQSDERRSNELLFHGSKTLEVDLSTSRRAMSRLPV